MVGTDDDLELLLSLGEAVPETPPFSPRPADGSDGAITPPRTACPDGTDMSVFRDAVKDYLEAAPAATSPLPKRPKRPKPSETLINKYSDLRIKHLALSPVEIGNRFANVRFMRISAIKVLRLLGDGRGGDGQGHAAGERAGERQQHLEDGRAGQGRGVGVPVR